MLMPGVYQSGTRSKSFQTTPESKYLFREKKTKGASIVFQITFFKKNILMGTFRKSNHGNFYLH